MLNQFVSVYIPSTNHRVHGDNVRLSAKDHRTIAESAAGELSRVAGGATILPATGYFLSETGALVAEKILIVKSFFETDSGILDCAHNIATRVKAQLNQESVSVETNDGLEFV